MKWYEHPYWWCYKKWLPLRYGRKFDRFLDDHPEHPEWDCVDCFYWFVAMERAGVENVRKWLRG